MPKPKQQVQSQNPPTYYLFLILLIVGAGVFIYLLFSWATGNKLETATIDEVRQVITEYGYEKQEYSEAPVDEAGESYSYMLFTKGDTELKFLTAHEDDNLKLSFFNILHKKIPVSSDYVKQRINRRANFQQVEIRYNGTLFYIMQIDNTALYIESPEENEDEIYSITRELGYVPEF